MNEFQKFCKETKVPLVFWISLTIIMIYFGYIIYAYI